MMLLCVAVRCSVFVVGSRLFDVCCVVICLLLSIVVGCWCRYWLLSGVCVVFVVLDCCVLFFLIVD